MTTVFSDTKMDQVLLTLLRDVCILNSVLVKNCKSLENTS